jgi:DNA mismatch repair protein MutS
MKITPMLRQYFDAKEKQPDALLFFRMGDFYELFFDDAKTASEVLDITLTSRNRGEPDEIPMAGVPFHAVDGYIQRLVDAGHRVAICEQLENPADVKGIVRRDVTRVITPGVRLDVDPAAARESQLVAAIAPAPKGEGWALALCDVSTGELSVTEVASVASAMHELARAGTRELVVPDSVVETIGPNEWREGIHRTVRPRDIFSRTALGKRLRDLQSDYGDREFRSAVLAPSDAVALVDAVDELGLRHAKVVGAALSGLLAYVAEVQLGVPTHVSRPVARRPSDYVALDAATEANLEIFRALIGGGRGGSLLSVLDHTVTALGARRLRTLLAYPLVDCARIAERLDTVEVLVTGETRRARIREQLRGVADIPRLTSRIVGGAGNARDLVALRESLLRVPDLMAAREESDPALLGRVFDGLDPCPELAALLVEALVDDPPATTRDGGMFRQGYDDDLDELLELCKSGNSWLLRYERAQRDATGIESLKLKYTKVFGYYLEVTRANLDRVPDDYIRRQTVANAERYFTAELKEYEDKITGASERRVRLEQQLFGELVAKVLEAAPRLQATAAALAELDAFAGLAEASARNDYRRPVVDDSGVTQIDEGRHPVVEKTTAGERFVPNSTLLNRSERQLLIVTGPNMAGKSTIIRQVALIQLMAQVGCFVPAKQARLGVVDQIFSRVGANDNLSQGQSTFMVEMTQTAHILANATARSLIVLDEIGRGTSTFDGLAIAWAVAEHICDELGARTMFATHYHELTELVRLRENAVNVSVAVKEWNDDIVFLRRLVEGPANQSYGIQVGRLAGLPATVVARAKQILANLEESAYTGGVPTLAIDHGAASGDLGADGDAKKRARAVPDSGQLDLFSAPPVSPAQSRVLAALHAISLETLTPIEALNQLYALKRELESR